MIKEKQDKLIAFLNKELDKEAKKLNKTVADHQKDLTGDSSSVVLKSKKIK